MRILANLGENPASLQHLSRRSVGFTGFKDYRFQNHISRGGNKWFFETFSRKVPSRAEKCNFLGIRYNRRDSRLILDQSRQLAGSIRINPDKSSHSGWISLESLLNHMSFCMLGGGGHRPPPARTGRWWPFTLGIKPAFAGFKQKNQE